MLLGKASEFQDLCGLHDELSFGLEFHMTGGGNLASLYILSPVFDLSLHSIIPHFIASVIDMAWELLT